MTAFTPYRAPESRLDMTATVHPVEAFRLPWPALADSYKPVLLELLIHGPTSRAELARRSGMSPASMTRITKAFSDFGLTIETEADRSGNGRPSMPISINPDLIHLVGVNLTNSALTLVRTDLMGKILHFEAVDLSDSSIDTVTTVLVEKLTEQQQVDPAVRGVGISLAGPVSATATTVRISPFLGWESVQLVRSVQQATGLPAVMENDVRALAAAEHWFGGAAGVDDFVLVTFGTGVGCGIVVNGNLLEGIDGSSGQIGHLPITDSGPLCEHGHRGCARSYLATACILAQAGQVTGRRDITYDEVLELSAQGHPGARRIVVDAGVALGRIIGTLASITGPKKVLVSGEGTVLASQVLDVIRAEAERSQHWTIPPVPIALAPFGRAEWARGAAVIALRRQLETNTQEG